MNRLEELGRVDAEKAYTRKGKKNLKAEKHRIVGELKRKKGGSTKRSMGPAGASTVSADGKRMAQQKKARGAMAQLTKLLDIAKKRKPSGRLTSDDLRRAMKRKVPKPLTGRSAAAKKAAGKSKKVATLIGSFKKGKGNPAGKDMSLRGRLTKRIAKLKKSKPLRGGGIAKRGMGKAK
jgi:hypothetical protein